MNVIDSLFTTEFQGDGSSSSITLSNYASRFIADIECLFGPRDRSFTLIGIVIDRTPGNLPQLWFPDSGIPPGDVEGRSKHVVIRLSRNALTDSARARWQLAHECVHVLDPWNLRVDGRPASWLEEGLATWYQNTRVQEAECHEGLYAVAESRVPGSGVRGRGSGERETTASSLAGKQQAREKEDNGGQGKDGPAGAIAQGGNGR